MKMKMMKIVVALFVWELACCVPVFGDKEHVQHQEHKLHDPVSKEEHFKDGDHNPDYDHDAVLGSHHTADEFEKLDPEESKKRLALLVDRMDENADSFVTKEELSKWVLNSFRHLDQEEAADKLAELDEDEDDHVSWDEYIHKTYGYKPDEVTEMEKDKNEEVQTFVRMIQEDKEKFDLADQDKDKKLDEIEFGAFLHPHDFPHMHDFEVARTLKDHDKNNDGFIDLGEYLGDRNSRMKYAEQALADAENFMEYDKNGDQKLDRAEIIQMTVPSQDPAAEMEAEHLIERSDTDGNGKLSVKEILDQFELWVGSAATDYGAKLQKMKTHDPGEL